jgi:hypothetical protein
MVKNSRFRRSFYGLSYKLVSAIIILVILAGLLYYFVFKNKPHVTTSLNPTISHLQASNPSSNSESRSSSQSNGVSQGTASDTHGQSSVGTSASQWTQSQSGLITVKSPSYGSTIKSGDQLAGSAQENQVQFRLIDDQAGVIAQGFLSVVNGNFSGTLNFTSHGSTGRLDVFTTGPAGDEVNEAQVPVKF